MKFDVVIVGGGSAGCVLASRLSEAPGRSVCLIEAGMDTPPGREPSVVKDVYYSTLYEPALFWSKLVARSNASRAEGRLQRPYEQGRVLGGGSAVNAMIGMRGLPGDHDEWELDGWRWDDVKPWYERLERDLDFQGPGHGSDGPIPIRRHRRSEWPGFCEAVATHLESVGWKLHPDMNEGAVDGLYEVPMTSTPTQRVSSAMGYLTAEVRARSNLTVMCESMADRLAMQGRRVTGVHCRSDRGPLLIEAGQVFVCAGAIHSPALLQRSGIGPAEVLSRAGVACVADLPGVGAGLQDHPMVSVASHLRPFARQGESPRAAANLGLRYSSNAEGCHGQDVYVSVANKGSWHAIGRQMGAFVMCLYKPYSRGSVAITSSRADDEPSVDFNLLDDERDEQRLMEAVRFAAGVYASEPLRRATHAAFPSGLTPRVRALNLVTPWNRFVSGLGAALLDGPAIVRNWLLEHVVNDGPSLADLLADEALLRRWVRERVIPFYHACGTCRMGAEGDATRVVDEQARVVGIDGLFVVDASVFPSIPRANTNLPSIMLAEKIASASQISPCTSAPS